MELNEILLSALIARVKAGDMTVEQVPIPYQSEIRNILNKNEGDKE